MLERGRHPGAASPSTTAPAAAVTSGAVLPYWRPNAPMGSFPDSVPAGTMSRHGREVQVHARGGELGAHVAGQCRQLGGWQIALVRGRRQAGEARAREGLDGATLLVGRDPQVRTRARPCQRCVVAATSVAGAFDRPAMNSPPTPSTASASPEARSSSGTPTRKSWAIRPRSSRAPAPLPPAARESRGGAEEGCSGVVALAEVDGADVGGRGHRRAEEQPASRTSAPGVRA